jgi:O-antigen ligase
MPDASIVRKIITDRELYLFSILFFVLPTFTNATSWCMWAIAALWIIDPEVLTKLKRAFTNKYVIFYLLPVFMLAITLLYTDNLSGGFKSLGNKIFLLLFPVVLSTFHFTRSKTDRLLRSFVCSVLFWAFLCISIGVYKFFTVETTFGAMAGDAFNRVVTPWNFLTNIQLVEPISISPIYMSTLTGIASIIIVYMITEEKRIMVKWLWILGAVFLFAFNVLLGARMGLISLIVALPFFYAFNFINVLRAHALRIVVVSGIAICFLTGLFFVNPILQKRFGKDMTNTSYPEELSGWNSVNLRAAIWDCSLQAAKKKIVFGYGLGSEHYARETCYKSFSFYGPFGTDLNSHNQYLEYILIGGLFLLAGLLASFGAAAFYAWKYRSALLLAFIIFIALNFLTESLLAVQKGIIIYSLFLSLFTFGSASVTENRNVSL